jgi:tRNA 2-thiouridine synthesizing protein B
MLHIIKQPATLSLALAYAAPEDLFLLVEGAVYVALPGHKAHQLLISAQQKTYVLQPDLAARGLAEFNSPVEQVDFAGFVDLTAEEDKSITW